jgi:hypothetical protein
LIFIAIIFVSDYTLVGGINPLVATLFESGILGQVAF